METSPSDYGILYVDDELKSLKYFEAIFEGLAPIHLANGPEEGFALFCEHHQQIGVVVSDKRMPGESGLSLLARIREVDPKPLRFLVTAYADLDAAVEGLNDGLLFSYLTKPWDPHDFEHRLLKALDHFALEREREQLIREKAEAFQQLLMADKAASIGILSSGLNHHLRNALTVLRTFHDLLPYQLEEEIGTKKPKDPAFWGEFHDAVGGQIDRMTSILTNLSEGAKLDRLDLVSGIDLAATLREAGGLVLAERSDIGFVVLAPHDLPTISGDARKLAQLARFLFEEARSSLADGGEIEVRLGSIQEGRGVEVTFIDNGPPLPDEDLARVFDPFCLRPDRSEEPGTRLMACYLTVFHHGGAIRAERTEDGRNALLFSLPVESPLSAAAGTGASPGDLWRLADFDRRDTRPSTALSRS